MGAMCKLFGHKMPSGWNGRPPYAKQPRPNIYQDQTGRGHVHLYIECARCGTSFHAVSFHPPQEWIAGDRPA
ncbi:MAG: hypothetical protein EON59_04035 [Alphaproteobacteria bacterium]|nr:MAG: hypothetical protein EON59_04035 [Alphaproteobacteria bacterium]